MVEVERGGEHSNELELEFKACIAAIQGLGRIRFEWRRGGLDARKARGFVHDTDFVSDGLKVEVYGAAAETWKWLDAQ